MAFRLRAGSYHNIALSLQNLSGTCLNFPDYWSPLCFLSSHGPSHLGLPLTSHKLLTCGLSVCVWIATSHLSLSVTFRISVLFMSSLLGTMCPFWIAPGRTIFSCFCFPLCFFFLTPSFELVEKMLKLELPHALGPSGFCIWYMLLNTSGLSTCETLPCFLGFLILICYC